MTTKVLLTAVAIALVAALSAPGDASAAGRKPHKRPPAAEARDCTPFNGPFGYYGNPWCDGGYKFAEDYPPGTGPTSMSSTCRRSPPHPPLGLTRPEAPSRNLTSRSFFTLLYTDLPLLTAGVTAGAIIVPSFG